MRSRNMTPCNIQQHSVRLCMSIFKANHNIWYSIAASYSGNKKINTHTRSTTKYLEMILKLITVQISDAYITTNDWNVYNSRMVNDSIKIISMQDKFPLTWHNKAPSMTPFHRYIFPRPSISVKLTKGAFYAIPSFSQWLNRCFANTCVHANIECISTCHVAVQNE